MRKGAALAIAAFSLATLAGCSGTGQDNTSESGNAIAATYAVVTHSAQGDAFWDRVKSGAEKAGSDYGATVTYSSDPDPAKQSQLIDNAVAQGVDGLVISMANPDGLEASVEKAVAAGIPVVTINSGIERSAEFGAFTHIGQSESVAGAAAGKEMKELGITKAICVLHEAGNIGHEERCKAAASTMGGTVENLQVDGTNDAEVKATIKAKLQADPTINGILALGAQFSIDAVGAVEEADSDAKVVTFDLTEDVIDNIQSGSILFAVDQQPYVQGFLGITALYLNSINGNVIGGGEPVYSGPAFITKDNVDTVAEFAKNGTR